MNINAPQSPYPIFTDATVTLQDGGDGSASALPSPIFANADLGITRSGLFASPDQFQLPRGLSLIPGLTEPGTQKAWAMVKVTTEPEQSMSGDPARWERIVQDTQVVVGPSDKFKIALRNSIIPLPSQ